MGAPMAQEQLRVSGARLLAHESRGGAEFYCIEVFGFSGQPWTVWKRYSQFDQLRASLRTNLRFPPKQFLCKSAGFLQTRQQGLTEWLTTVLAMAQTCPGWAGKLNQF